MRHSGSVLVRHLVVLALLAATPVAALHAQGAGNAGAGEPLPALMVSGRASVAVTPDRAELGIAVESRSRTAAQASSDNARIQTAVLDALRRLGVTSAQIQTRSVQVSPEFQYPREGGRPTLTGYVARNEVVLTLSDLTKVGPAIDAALAQGATQVSGPRFTLANPDSARREALDAAVRKAMADAQVMARAAGVRVGRILEISSMGTPEAMEFARPTVMMRASADAAPTPVEAGVITIEASVQIRVAIFP
ncbi:MAG: hypothetical protein C0503_01335 [Gemmatimonas sp.]|nr:hypothetical protein [Gemmatimonas sp.]